MRKASLVSAIVLCSAAVAACAKSGPVRIPDAPAAASVTAQKWFSVDKYNPWYWSCLVRVTPSDGPATHVKVGMELAWVLANECDDSADLTLTFFRNGNPQQEEEPIEFQPVVNGVLKGRVKVIMDLPPGGLRFKYTAQSGRHKKDPEIVIFP